jgi:predicted DNA-binding protein (MmcQ/YjbR family)
VTREEIEALALSMPAATKVVQWGGSDVYKVGGKVFAICGLQGGLAFKVTEIGFMVLTENGPGRQAPYLARGHWVVVDLDDMDEGEARSWIETSHGLIAAKLTRATRADLGLA